MDAKNLRESYARQARSMDGMPKPYMSQPMLAVRSYGSEDMNNFDESSQTNSPASTSPRHSSQLPLPQQPPKGRNSVSGISPDRMDPSRGLAALTSMTTVRSTVPEGLPRHSTEQGLILDLNQRPRRQQTQSANLPLHVPMTQMTSSLTPQTQTQRSLKALSVSSPSQVYNRTIESESNPSMLVPMSESQSGIHTNESRGTTSENTRVPAYTPTHTLRRAAPRLKSLPPSIFTRVTEDGGARLSPSIIPRPTQRPMMNFPVLPIPAPTTTRETMPPRMRLASVPALPRHGPTDRDMDSDHENATLEEEEEEEDDYHDARSAEVANGMGSDDEDGEDQEGSSPGSGGRPQAQAALSTPRITSTPLGTPHVPIPAPSRYAPQSTLR